MNVKGIPCAHFGISSTPSRRNFESRGRCGDLLLPKNVLYPDICTGYEGVTEKRIYHPKEEEKLERTVGKNGTS